MQPASLSPERLALYRSLATVEVVAAGDAGILAAIHPDLAPAGSLSAPWGDPGDHGAAVAAGEAWLRARGCRRVLGPMEVCTWFPYRANLGPHDLPPFPTEPAAAPEPWLAAGYAVVARYTSQFVPHGPQLRDLEGAGVRVPLGFRLRTLDPARVEAALHDAWRISLQAFAGAFAFVPVTFEVFRALHLPSAARLDPAFALLLDDPEGEPAAFCLTFPGGPPGDGPFPQGTVIYKTLAVRPDCQGLGLGRVLLHRVHRAALERGYLGGLVHALMWTRSTSQRMAPGAGRVIREYVLYRKRL